MFIKERIMKLNCDRGDVAVVITGKYRDRFVLCEEYIGDKVHGKAKDYWRIDRVLGMDHTGYISDSILRPIRNLPGADQTLLWAGLPKDVQRVSIEDHEGVNS